MADETRVQVLKEPERKAETDSFMWLFRTGEDGLAPSSYINIRRPRAGFNAADFLKGFKGYLETDCYQGYNSLADVKRCCCWAHLRRYFVEAVPKGKNWITAILPPRAYSTAISCLNMRGGPMKKGIPMNRGRNTG